MFSIKPGIVKNKFTVEEDCLIMAAVKEYGHQNFQKFPRNLLAGRTSIQIRNRYKNVLRFVGHTRSWNSCNNFIDLIDF